MKKTVLILLAFFALTSVFAQQSLNDYKYIIVPNKFDFLKEADEHKLNSLTKFLFEKYNFEAIMEEDEVLPSDYAKNNCLGLKADVLKESNIFKTRLTVQLKNCKNEVIYTTSQGESRAKNFKVGYYESLRQAFKSFETVDYNYIPKNEITTNEAIKVVGEKQEEIKKLREEVKTLRDNKKTEMIIVTKTEIEKEVIKEPVSVSSLPNSDTTKDFDVLYAQKTPNGFQLVDNTPKVIYKIRRTGMSNVYLVEEQNGILYQLDANWIIEYYENEKLQTKIINIKF